jgi:hypothetical protein
LIINGLVFFGGLKYFVSTDKSVEPGSFPVWRFFLWHGGIHPPAPPQGGKAFFLVFFAVFCDNKINSSSSKLI